MTAATRTCPAWCSERHEADDEPHWGPAYDVVTRSLPDPVMVCLQQDPGRDVEISIEPTSVPSTVEDRARAFTLDQARELYAVLGRLLAVADEATGQ